MSIDKQRHPSTELNPLRSLAADVLTIDHAIDLLTNAAAPGGTADTPFYLAVGLHKPHMPWIAKPEHFALYDIDENEVAKQKTSSN